ncbi:putative pentatricopeptide [Rosa chinensis]|uniref:Putative pentatricopeptide n=1 Tax=Rosa chinensis TaxID=74649 RepID=A0A2P6QPB4_ROSCH|nr:putative pentatricopeptide [Rosa chinensis]
MPERNTLKDVALSDRVCACIGKSGLKSNMLMVNSLVDVFMKFGDTSAAKWLFDECVDKNLRFYSAVLSNYVRQGLAGEAVSVMGEMLQQGLRPDKVTMLSAISACAQLSDSLTGKCCHGYVLRNGLEGWDTICNAMIDMYMKCGLQEMA